MKLAHLGMEIKPEAGFLAPISRTYAVMVAPTGTEGNSIVDELAPPEPGGGLGPQPSGVISSTLHQETGKCQSAAF